MSTDRDQPDIPVRSPSHWLWGPFAGLVFAAIGLGGSMLAQVRVSPTALGSAGEITAANLLGGVFLCGWLVWWLVVIRPRQDTALRGAVAGVLVACLSYPAVLLLAHLVNTDRGHASDSSLLEQVTQALVQSLLGLVTTGFASTIALAVSGVLIALLQHRLTPYPEVPAGVRPPGVLRRLFHGLVVITLSIVGVLVVGFVVLTVLPVPPLSGVLTPQPATDYQQALDEFSAIEAREAALPLRPECHSQLRTHGTKVARVVVYFHGLTSCPAQGDALAQQLFDKGYNVVVPRLPGHGEEDPLTLALAHMTAEDLVNTANTAIGIAHGVGEDVIIVGLSAGGTVTTYETQQNDTLGNAVAVAPFLGPDFLPPWTTRAATNLLLRAPNLMIWWNSKTPYSSPEMPYVYPRYATRAVGELMRLGRIVAGEAETRRPAAQGIGVLLNRADKTINAPLVEQLVREWEKQGAAVDLRFLPLEDGLPHDVIDPRQPHGNINIVYPTLFEMISATSK